QLLCCAGPRCEKLLAAMLQGAGEALIVVEGDCLARGLSAQHLCRIAVHMLVLGAEHGKAKPVYDGGAHPGQRVVPLAEPAFAVRVAVDIALIGVYPANEDGEAAPSRGDTEGAMRLYLAVICIALVTLTVASCGTRATPDFVREAAVNDMYEAEAGKLAAARGQSETVKQFAQQMVEAHTQITAELKGVVDAEKIDVTLPSELDEQ